MKILDKLAEALGFNATSGEFELLETERGTPAFLANRDETPPRGHEDESELSGSLEKNVNAIRVEFRSDINPDLIVRRFLIGGRLPAAAVFMNGMAKSDIINDFIIRDGMRAHIGEDAGPPHTELLMERVFTMSDVESAQRWTAVRAAVSEGRTAVFTEGDVRAILMDTRGYEHRAVSMPENEKVVRGPQEGFTENLRTNITLLRRMIRREDLVCEMRSSGGGNNLKAAIIYLEGSANAALVEEVKRRLARVDARSIMSMGVLEQLTEAHAHSPIPQLLSTERPDRVASHIMQGHVAVLMEGSPFANVMPATFFTLMASPEDAYLRCAPGNVLRVVRYVGAALSVLLPAYFLALALYHQGMMSTEVLNTIVVSRKMVFAPIGVELVFLLLVFQLIREAGLRVPGSIGQAIGIIGGLIMGQAAVSANLVSSVLLIVVAMSGLGNFCIPDYSMQLAASYVRLIFVAASWLAGLLGLACAVTAAVGYMATLKSYGVPFLAPYAPKTTAQRPAILRGRITMHRRAADYSNTREES